METTETKQADSQLSFATKIIKIELLVFENELIEDAIPAPTDPESSKSEKRDVLRHACTRMYLLLGGTDTRMHEQIKSFCTFWFLGAGMASSINSFSKTSN